MLVYGAGTMDDDGRGEEYAIHLDGLLSESALVSVRVCECV